MAFSEYMNFSSKKKLNNYSPFHNNRTPKDFPTVYLHEIEGLKTDRKWMLFLNNCHTTVSGYFFAMCMCIFHKIEVQTVILICSTGWNSNWFKSYDLKRSLRPYTTFANSQKIATDKWPFYDNFWPFFHQLYVHLSQNWGSDGHFDVLTQSKS